MFDSTISMQPSALKSVGLSCEICLKTFRSFSKLGTEPCKYWLVLSLPFDNLYSGFILNASQGK